MGRLGHDGRQLRRGGVGHPLHRHAGLCSASAHRLRPSGHRLVLGDGHGVRHRGVRPRLDIAAPRIQGRRRRPGGRRHRRHAFHRHVGVPAPGRGALGPGLCDRFAGDRRDVRGACPAGHRAQARPAPRHSGVADPDRGDLRHAFHRHGGGDHRAQSDRRAAHGSGRSSRPGGHGAGCRRAHPAGGGVDGMGRGGASARRRGQAAGRDRRHARGPGDVRRRRSAGGLERRLRTAAPALRPALEARTAVRRHGARRRLRRRMADPAQAGAPQGTAHRDRDGRGALGAHREHPHRRRRANHGGYRCHRVETSRRGAVLRPGPRRGRQPGQERIPRQSQPRDPHAAERGGRTDRRARRLAPHR